MVWPIWEWNFNDDLGGKLVRDRVLYVSQIPAPGHSVGVTAEELIWIELACDFIADAWCCKKCGAWLSRRRRVRSIRVSPVRWWASVETRCSGLLRHKHVSRIIEENGDLVLLPFEYGLKA